MFLALLLVGVGGIPVNTLPTNVAFEPWGQDVFVFPRHGPRPFHIVYPNFPMPKEALLSLDQFERLTR